MHGVRRTILTASPLMVAGAVMSALAGQLRLAGGRPDPDRHRLRAGLPGVHGVHRAALSAGALHHGLPASSWRWAAGMLATGTPLAWLIEASSWRMGFWVLALCAALSWAPSLCGCASRRRLQRRRASRWTSLRTFGALFGCRTPWASSRWRW
jgi:hypothetical protein